MARRPLVRWERPRLRTAEDVREPRVISVDLFYDLVFAVVVAQLATTLSEHISLAGLGAFALFFVPAVRLWSAETLYSDRFETRDVSYRISVFLSMVAAAGLALAAPRGLGEQFPVFALSYVAARIVQLGQWIRAGRHEALARSLVRRYMVVYPLESVLWIAAIFAPGPLRVAFVGLAILTDLLLPLTTSGLQAQIGKFSHEHLSDRFGAFFLLVLGQLVLVAILIMTRSHTPSPQDLEAGALAFLLAFTLWWLYVDHVVGRPLRIGPWWRAIWIYLHVPLFMSVAAVGSAVFSFVTQGEQLVTDPVRLLLCWSFALALLFTGFAESALAPLLEPQRRLIRTARVHDVPALIAFLVGIFGRGLTAVPLLAILCAVGVFAVVYGEYFRAGLE